MGFSWAHFRAQGREAGTAALVQALPAAPCNFQWEDSHSTGPWCESNHALGVLLLACDNEKKSMDYNYRTLKLSIAQTVMKIRLWCDSRRLTVHLSPDSTAVYHVAGLVPLMEGTTSRARLPQ